MLAQSRPEVRTYLPGASMARHEHDEPSLSFVVHGGFLEHLGRRTRDYTRGHVAFFPAGVPHAQTFGPLGARQITIRPEPAWVDYLVDCKVPIEDVRMPTARSSGGWAIAFCRNSPRKTTSPRRPARASCSKRWRRLAEPADRRPRPAALPPGCEPPGTMCRTTRFARSP
jgi:hypothetical protein